MTCVFKNMPGQPCCTTDASCVLIPADVNYPDAGFVSLDALQDVWNLRDGSWDDVTAGSGLATLGTGVQLLAQHIPGYSPYGVKFSTWFRGSVSSELRFYVGADSSSSVFAKVTPGEDCGQLAFVAEDGDVDLGNDHWIRQLRSRFWHKMTLCYDPDNGYVTATINTRTRTPVQNELQRLTFTGSISGGTFTLTFGDNLETAAITWSGTAATLGANTQAALDGIVGASNTDVRLDAQTLTVAGTSGQVTLSYDGANGTALAAPFGSTTAADVLAALEAIPALADMVQVSGPDGGPWRIQSAELDSHEIEATTTGDSTAILPGTEYLVEFMDALGSCDLPQLMPDSSLTGTSADVTVATIYHGQGNDVQILSLAGTTDSVRLGWDFGYRWEYGDVLSAPYDSLTAAEIQEYVEAICEADTPYFTPPNVTVSGADGGPWIIRFCGHWAGVDTPTIGIMCSGQMDYIGYVTLSPLTATRDGQTIWSTFLNGGTVTATPAPPDSPETISSGSSGSVVEPVRGETWVYSAPVTATDQAGYGLGLEAGSAEFFRPAATALKYLREYGLGGPCGDVTIETTQEHTEELNEIQTVTISGDPSAGSFTLKFDGETTIPIAWNSSAGTVESALEALSTIGTGNVSVTGPTGTGPFAVEFTGAMANSDVPDLTATNALQNCACVPTGGEYPTGCIYECATCTASCEIAGASFSSRQGNCDWDGAGYVIADSAVGTGALSHRTQINAAPYRLQAEFSGCAYPDSVIVHADTAEISFEWRRVFVDPDYDYWLDLKVDGEYVDTFHVGTYADPPASGEIVLTACRYSNYLHVVCTRNYDEANHNASCAVFSPGYISIESYTSALTVTVLNAKRLDDALACSETCPGTTNPDCDGICADDQFPLSMLADIVGLEDATCGCAWLNTAREIPLVDCIYEHEFALDTGNWTCPDIVWVDHGIPQTVPIPTPYPDRMLISVWPVVLGDDINTALHVRTSAIFADTVLWTPEDDHYYLCVRIRIFRLYGTNFDYYYAADIGTTKPVECMKFDDLACVCRGTNQTWATDETGAPWLNMPCGHQGALEPGGLWYATESNSIVYITSLA